VKSANKANSSDPKTRSRIHAYGLRLLSVVTGSSPLHHRRVLGQLIYGVMQEIEQRMNENEGT